MPNQEHSQEVKQHHLEQLEASKQAIQELNNDELENVTGGKFGWRHAAIGAAASFFGPQLLGSFFGGSSSSQSTATQGTTQGTATQGTTQGTTQNQGTTQKP